MSSRWIPAVALIAVVGASGCTIRTGEAADAHHHHRDKSPPPPPPPKKKAHQDAKPEPKAEPKPKAEAPPPAPPVDSGYRDANEAWEKLGEGTANGKNDHDVIKVGKKEGKFRALRFRVKNSNVKIQNLVIYFPDGTKYSPSTKVEFKEGEVSNTIDLPGERRAIQSVNFKYSDSIGSGSATVEVWGI